MHRGRGGAYPGEHLEPSGKAVNGCCAFTGRRAALAEDARDGQDKAPAVAFRNVVCGAARERFRRALLSDGSRDKDEWHARSFPHGELQSGEAVILREGEIRENQVRRKFAQLRTEFAFGLDATPRAWKTAAGDLQSAQLGIRLVIVDDQ
jgi:hypothetical protein